TLAIAGCGSDTPSNAATLSTKQPPPLPADVQQVGAAITTTSSTTTTGPAEVSGDTFVSTGEFVSPVRSELAARVPGRVSKMYVDAGSMVKRGDPVLSLETDYLALQLQQAEAEAA